MNEFLGRTDKEKEVGALPRPGSTERMAHLDWPQAPPDFITALEEHHASNTTISVPGILPGDL